MDHKTPHMQIISDLRLRLERQRLFNSCVISCSLVFILCKLVEHYCLGVMQ